MSSSKYLASVAALDFDSLAGSGLGSADRRTIVDGPGTGWDIGLVSVLLVADSCPCSGELSINQWEGHVYLPRRSIRGTGNRGVFESPPRGIRAGPITRVVKQ